MATPETFVKGSQLPAAEDISLDDEVLGIVDGQSRRIPRKAFKAPLTVPDLPALRALTGMQEGQAVDTSDGETVRRWRFDLSDDFSDEITADPDGNYVVAPDSDPTGASGVWRWLGAASKYDRSYSRHSNAVGVGENYSLGPEWDYTHLSGAGFISNTTANSGWAARANLADYVDVQLPFGVIIGDSIAEGHPALHGRLHPGGVDTYDANYDNTPGQPSYELGRHTNMYWYNHGIGGQTSGDVWDRWRRDVLAETYDPGDGRGDSTLPRMPHCVIVNVGINDIFGGVSLGVIKINMIKMALSARENGIIIGFNTVGPHALANTERQKQIKEMREWALQIMPRYGAYVFDFFAWFEDPSAPDTPNPDLAADNVHPSKGGYSAWARSFLDQTRAPIVMGGINISTVGGEAFPSYWVNPVAYRAQDIDSGRVVVVRAVNQAAVIPPVFDMSNRRNLRLSVADTDGENISTNRTGISGVSGAFGQSEPSECIKEVAGLIVLDAVEGWIFDKTGLVETFGMRNVSANSSFISFTTDYDVDHVQVTQWASSSAPNRVPLGVTIAETGNRFQWRISLWDCTTGDRVDPTTLIPGSLLLEVTASIRQMKV